MKITNPFLLLRNGEVESHLATYKEALEEAKSHIRQYSGRITIYQAVTQVESSTPKVEEIDAE